MNGYCLHTAVSCENILFWTPKSGFCPSFPETRWWPTDSRGQRGQRFPLLPPSPDVIRPCTGDPSAADKAQWEGSSLRTKLHGGHHAGAEQSITNGQTAGRPSWFPCPCWLWRWCPGKSWAQGREAEPRKQSWGCAIFDNVSLWGATGRQRSWWLLL